MGMKSIKFGIDDLNFILTFAGFPIVTTLLPSVPSILYRAFALVIAIICLFKNGLNFPYVSRAFKVFLVFLVLVDLRVLIEMMFVDGHTASRNMCLIFTFGVCLIPSLSVFTGLDKINWKSMMWVLWLLLLASMAKAAATLGQTVDGELDVTRVSLNERQSTLSLGDNGGYLIVLSVALLAFRKTIDVTWKRIGLFFVVATGIAVGGYCLLKSGSRGPFLSVVVALFLMFMSLKMNIGKRIVVIAVFAILLAGGLLDKISSVAPVLFERMTLFVKSGDLSGREELFREAWRILSDNPLFGGNPIILESGNEFTTYHNGFLDVGLATGLIGMVVYSILNMVLLYRSASNRMSVSSPMFFLSVGLLGMSVMRSMSGSGLIISSPYILSIGLASLIFSSNSSFSQNLKQ